MNFLDYRYEALSKRLEETGGDLSQWVGGLFYQHIPEKTPKLNGRGSNPFPVPRED